MHFTEVAAKAGILQPPHNGFVCFMFDYNNDGWPDILTTSLAPWEVAVEGLKKGYAPPNARSVHPDASRLFRNNGNGTFTDVTFESKLYYPTGTMGAGVADLDNDGYLGFVCRHRRSADQPSGAEPSCSATTATAPLRI